MRTKIRKIIIKFFFFVGWLLSPVTFWNDAFINIPLSYFISIIIIKYINVGFLTALIVSYWLTNLVGIVIMYTCGNDIMRGAKSPARELVKLALVMIFYSFLVVFLGKLGILKP